MNTSRQYDLIIAGAGMVGATLANALSDSGLHIAIIEARQPQLSWEPGSVDLRVSAISLASQQIFEHIQVWSSMQALGVSPYLNMCVWESGDDGNGEIHFDSADIGVPQLGHIIENRVIVAALLQRLQQHERIELLCPARLSGLQHYPDHVTVRLDDGSELQTRLLVGADGGRSSVRQLVGIDSRGWSYRQQGVVSVVETEQAHQQTAWQRFIPGGPLAFLPLADGRSSIVWSATTAQAQRLLACDAADFHQQLGEAFGFRLGAITASEQRAAFPLQLQYARDYVRPRIALIGDAAHTIHPLAGQGVNLGLLDAAALAEVIVDSVANEQDIGGLRPLRRYERWRKGDNLLTMGVMDGFNRLFGSAGEPLQWIRSNGLNLVDSLPLIKQQLMHQAVGHKRDLPRMARTAY